MNAAAELTLMLLPCQQFIVCRARAKVLACHCLKLDERNETLGLLTIMATNKASAPKAFIAVSVCVITAGFGRLADPSPHPTRLAHYRNSLPGSAFQAAAIALIVAIYFTCRALTVREPQKESDLEFEEDDNGEKL
jgi:hypothetical protein